MSSGLLKVTKPVPQGARLGSDLLPFTLAGFI